MGFDNIVSRVDADVLIPEDVADQIITAATEESVALTAFRQVRMPSKTTRLPVTAALPVAYWVNGDTGLKQTTEAMWRDATLIAEEIAAIVPVPEAVVDDASFDIFGELRPLLAEAIAITLDQAVFTGINKPAMWGASVIEGAIAAGNVHVGGAPPEEGGTYGDLEATISLVEDDGFDVSAIGAAKRLRRGLRRARSATGELLGEGSSASAWDVPISYFAAGVLPTDVLAVTGDYSLGIVGIRQDITYKVLDQAVITDDTGSVIYNLPQQDMIALRVVARFGFATAVPVARTDAGDPTTIFPFAVLQDQPAP